MPAEGKRLAHARDVVDLVDADAVVFDEVVDLGDDGFGDAPNVLDPVQPYRQVLDGLQSRGHAAERGMQLEDFVEQGRELALVGGDIGGRFRLPAGRGRRRRGCGRL